MVREVAAQPIEFLVLGLLAVRVTPDVISLEVESRQPGTAIQTAILLASFPSQLRHRAFDRPAAVGTRRHSRLRWNRRHDLTGGLKDLLFSCLILVISLVFRAPLSDPVTKHL